MRKFGLAVKIVGGTLVASAIAGASAAAGAA
jgi:hypothetical protein